MELTYQHLLLDLAGDLESPQSIMDRPGDSQRPAQAQQQPKPVKEVPPTYRSLYLILYNFVSVTLWLVVLGRTLLIAGTFGSGHVYEGVGELTKWTQTLAALEVVHSLVGMNIRYLA